MIDNSDKDFIAENDNVFRVAYSGKCILLIRRRVVKTFDSLCDAMMFVDETLNSVDYIIADYTGPESSILYR